jgi:hypothetical protein
MKINKINFYNKFIIFKNFNFFRDCKLTEEGALSFGKGLG